MLLLSKKGKILCYHQLSCKHLSLTNYAPFSITENGLIVNVSQAENFDWALILLTPEQMLLPLVSKGEVITDEYLSKCELMERVAVTPQ